MPIHIKKRKNENISAFLYRFSKRIRQSGVLKEAKGRRFHTRRVNRNKRRASSLYRIAKVNAINRQKKYGSTGRK